MAQQQPTAESYLDCNQSFSLIEVSKINLLELAAEP